MRTFTSPQDLKSKQISIVTSYGHLLEEKEKERNTLDIHLPESLMLEHERASKSRLRKRGTAAELQINSTLALIRENQTLIAKRRSGSSVAIQRERKDENGLHSQILSMKKRKDFRQDALKTLTFSLNSAKNNSKKFTEETRVMSGNTQV